MNQFHVPTTPQPKTNFNAVTINVDHSKVHQHITATYYPSEKHDNGLVTIAITNGKTFKIEPMTRLNRAKVAAAFALAKQQVADKSGLYFDHLKTFITERGFTLAE